MSLTSRTILAGLALAAGCANEPGTARPASRGEAAPARSGAVRELRATLTAAGDVELRWSRLGDGASGAWIEFATPGSDFVLLEAVGAETTTYLHPQVAPGTTFLYRLRPYFGATSPVAVVRLGAPGDLPERADDAEGPLEEPVPATAPAARSLRASASAALAAPAELSATPSSPTSVDLRWTDRAGDEDGYLVEIATDGSDFAICALLPPDSRSFRKTRLPAGATRHFRVRAFFHGEPSPLASATTPAS